MDYKRALPWRLSEKQNQINVVFLVKKAVTHKGEGLHAVLLFWCLSHPIED